MPPTPGLESADKSDDDLLSDAKIANIRYARKDAKTTNSGSMGAQTGRRRGAAIAGRFEARHKGSAKAYA
jgi:hypothetical protein